MTDEVFNAITENVKQFRPVLEQYRGDESKLTEVTASLEELVSDTEEYASLITQYNYNKPKFNILARSVFYPGVNNNALVDAMSMSFDIDNACGVQLDVIGRLIGLGRLLTYVPASGDRVMDDDEYRLALKLTIAKNTWDGTLGSLRQIYKDALREDISIVYVDNQDMSVDINIYGSATTRQTEMMNRSGLLLVPVGVGKSVNVVGDDTTVSLNMNVEISGIEWLDGIVHVSEE